MDYQKLMKLLNEKLAEGNDKEEQADMDNRKEDRIFYEGYTAAICDIYDAVKEGNIK